MWNNQPLKHNTIIGEWRHQNEFSIIKEKPVGESEPK